MEKGKEGQGNEGDSQQPVLVQGVLYNRNGIQVLDNRMENVRVITTLVWSKHDPSTKGTAELLISGESTQLPKNLKGNGRFLINSSYSLPQRALFVDVVQGSAANIVARGYSVIDKDEMAEFIPYVSASELLKPIILAPLSELSIKLFRRKTISADFLIVNFSIEVPKVSILIIDKANGEELMLNIDEKAQLVRLQSKDEAYKAYKKAKQFLRTSNELPFGELRDDELQ